MQQNVSGSTLLTTDPWKKAWIKVLDTPAASTMDLFKFIVKF